MSSQYVLITPCRDEEQYARRTLDSVVRQTVRPSTWLIVDDGSSDGTPAILAEYAEQHAWIRVLRLGDRGARSLGRGVVEAFEAGHRELAGQVPEFLGKLDLDLELPPRYFEVLLERMRADPRLGTCSGKPYCLGANGTPVAEACGDEMSVGMTKLYRRTCYEEIGGLVPAVMWDGIDCHRCRMLGWKAQSFDAPELRFLHLRRMGSSDGGLWRGRVRHGSGQYAMGTGPVYMTASALYRSPRPPVVLGGLGMAWGWLRAFLARTPRYGDREFRRFLRRYQRECLLFGKRRATARLDARQAERWRARDRTRSEVPAIDLMGVRVHAIREEDCVQRVCADLAAGRGGWVLTPNLDHLRRLAGEASYRETCAGADLCVADGMPLVWAARLQGTPLPERVAGSNLIWSLSAAAAERGYSIYLLGGEPGAGERAAEVLRARFPGLEIAGIDCPPHGFEQDEVARAGIVRRLCEARPAIVFVALGSPKQERLIRELRELLPSSWWLGIGISFSFVAGTIRRAPAWMQRFGIEWVHRLAQEPRRLARRYLVDGLPFAAVMLGTSLGRRLGGGARR